MLTISDEAAVLIRSLLADAHLPTTAGLRLATDDETHALAMQLASEPHLDDVVITYDGATLFVSPFAARRVGEQTLYAQVEGRRAFFVD